MERLQDDKNSAIVDAESVKMLAQELQEKVDAPHTAEERFTTTEAKAAESEKATCEDQLAKADEKGADLEH